MSPNEVMIFSIKTAFAAAAVIAVLIFVIVPLWRHLRTGPDPELFDPSLAFIDEEGEELEVPQRGADGKPDRQAVIDQARRDPHAAALMVSSWLKQKN